MIYGGLALQRRLNLHCNLRREQRPYETSVTCNYCQKSFRNTNHRLPEW